MRETISKPTGDITQGDVASVTSLDVSARGIDDLSGIEYFTALTELLCSSNNLTSLDVSKNVELQDLVCSFNELTSLNISNNTKLYYLDVGYNKLTLLDIWQNSELELFDCTSNKLEALDISKNTKLRRLFCGVNPLSALDVSKNTELKNIYSQGTKITNLSAIAGLDKNKTKVVLNSDNAFVEWIMTNKAITAVIVIAVIGLITFLLINIIKRQRKQGVN